MTGLIWAAPAPVLRRLADTTGATGDDYGKAAPIGLAVIVALGIVCYFLAKSMNRNLKKVPPSFDPAPDPAPQASGAESTVAAPADSAGLLAKGPVTAASEPEAAGPPAERS